MQHKSITKNKGNTKIWDRYSLVGKRKIVEKKRKSALYLQHILETVPYCTAID